MKPLVLTIALAILAIFLTGCVIVREHHHGYASRAVIVTRPRHLPIGPGHPPHPDARHHIPRRNHPRFRRMHR